MQGNWNRNSLGGNFGSRQGSLLPAGLCERVGSWLLEWLYQLFRGPCPRRYRVTPRCRSAVFRRQLLADVLHSLKQSPMD